jgi:divalent metal cation (Fe/Co/Zn/Cd) transporter
VREHRGDIISGYHKLRARRAGSRRHVDLHVLVDENLTITEAHDIAEHIEDDIRACIPNTDVLVHVEPRTHKKEGGEVATPRRDESEAASHSGEGEAAG